MSKKDWTNWSALVCDNAYAQLARWDALETIYRLWITGRNYAALPKEDA